MTPPRGLLISGTDTGVGKTRVAASIARGLWEQGRRVGVLKPVATGAERGPDGISRWSDVELLGQAVGGGIPRERIAPLVYEEALAPPLAARRRGGFLEHHYLLKALGDSARWWVERRGVEILIVEGVGGWLCPLAEGKTVADLGVELDYPVVLVARRGLGTLNHTLLTVESARARGVRVAGVLLNGASPTIDRVVEATNPEELVRRLPPDVPLLAEVAYQEGEPERPLWASGNDVDWWGRSAIPRISWSWI